MRLEGKTALITGAGRGIGRAIARRMAADGASVVVADLNLDNAASAAAEVLGLSGKAHAVQVDISDSAAVQAMLAETLRVFGRLDVIVNNAGVGLTKLLLDTTLEEWERVLRVNLTGVFLCSQAAARVMIQQRSGRIINIASLSGQRGGTGRAAYGASKAGVTALTRVMAVELAPYGITVNEIAPGPVNTEMTAVTHDDATRQAYYNLVPMRRYAEREEIAAAAVFLASADAAFINGHTLNVDGGFQAAGLMFDLKE
ncbi:MAG: glucose 1-dehydrogenase [Acidobacteria bacterium]|nr:glucose 1-dehydrogenase [Acidobacteriota bacterium]MBI3280508.1 glucose 1-dehydrogenase [Acidobacteriota bacterium]